MNEKQKKEALVRMEMLGLSDVQKQAFEKDGTVYVFNSPAGIPAKMDDEMRTMIKEFEERFNCMVYAVIATTTIFSTADSFLYVSDTEEEWEGDREDLSNRTPFAYVRNHLSDLLSEFGSIVVDQVGTGRLTRIG